LSVCEAATSVALTPHVLKFNRPAIEEPACALAARLRLEPTLDAHFVSVSRPAALVGIPARITDLG
jgi:hypothetical protein